MVIEKKEDLVGKKIVIVGLARTGVAASKFLSEAGAKVTVSDHKSKAELADYLDLMEGVEVEYDLGGHTPKTFLEQDIILLSPGISPQLKIFDYARQNGVHVTGEFEFMSQFITKPIIAVTGTNGKTTTVSLIREMLMKSGINVWVGGNYGKPVSEYFAEEVEPDVVLFEVSSFMLEHVVNFTPKNVIFMNLAENHLDRHKTMEDYVNAKRKVFLNTHHGTTSILNADDNAVVELARDPAVQRGRIFYFSRKASLEPQIMNIGGAVNIRDEIKVRTGPEIEVFSVKNKKMRGAHSIENLMAAMLVCREHGANS